MAELDPGKGLDAALDKLGIRLNADQRAKLRVEFNKGTPIGAALKNMGFQNVGSKDFSGVKAILQTQTPAQVSSAQAQVKAAPDGAFSGGQSGGGSGGGGGGNNIPSGANTTTTTAILTPQQEKVLDLAMPNIKDFANDKILPPPDTVTDFTAEQKLGQDLAMGAVGTQNQLAATGANALNTSLNRDPTNMTGALMPAPGVRDATGVVRGAQDVEGFVDPRAATGSFLTDTAILDPSSNPHLAAAIRAGTQPSMDRLLEDILPAIRGEAVTSGNFGSSRQGVAEGIAAGRTQREMLDISSKMASEGYGQGLSAMGSAYGDILGTAANTYGTEVGNETNRQIAEQQAASGVYDTQQQAETQQHGTTQGAMTNIYGTNVDASNRALALLPTVQAAQTTGALTASGVGDVKQANTERELQQEADQFMFKQYEPLTTAQGLLGLMPAIPGGTNVAAGPVPESNVVGGALGGAATGATLGSVIPGIGTAVGAGAGALAGAYGSLTEEDRRKLFG